MHDLEENRIEEKIYFNVEVIQNLDPLQADAELDKLPELNRRGDTANIVKLLQYLAKTFAKTEIETPEAALATMRDIGIVVGSLKRHGVEPVTAVPEIEWPLLQLGDYTNMIPRDTVHHYTSWEPSRHTSTYVYWR